MLKHKHATCAATGAELCSNGTGGLNVIKQWLFFDHLEGTTAEAPTSSSV
jgi:hypothetical protein